MNVIVIRDKCLLERSVWLRIVSKCSEEFSILRTPSMAGNNGIMFYVSPMLLSFITHYVGALFSGT